MDGFFAHHISGLGRPSALHLKIRSWFPLVTVTFDGSILNLAATVKKVMLRKLRKF